jgi:hypothetical protein
MTHVHDSRSPRSCYRSMQRHLRSFEAEMFGETATSSCTHANPRDGSAKRSTTAPVFVDSNVLLYARDSAQRDKQQRAEAWMTDLWRTRRG